MTRLGKYELLEKLGEGGFGIVYRSLDRSLEREVVLKVLHPQLAVDVDFLERIRREAKLIDRLDHPNIVGIYELGEDQGSIYIVMKYLPGGSLAKRLEAKGALPFAEALKVIEDVCAGLESRKGFVHRDLKPANILFDDEGQAVVSDFGLAREVQISTSSLSSTLGGVDTPFYRAPELWCGKPPASPATDVYALACVFVEMLTGKALFQGNTPDEVITKHLVEGPRFPPQWPQRVPDGVEVVLRQALAKEPGERFPSAGEFARALRGCAEQAAEREKDLAGLREAVEMAMRLGEWEEAGRLLGEWAQLAPKDAVVGVYLKKTQRKMAEEKKRREEEEKRRLEVEEEKKRAAEEKKRREEEQPKNLEGQGLQPTGKNPNRPSAAAGKISLKKLEEKISKISLSGTQLFLWLLGLLTVTSLISQINFRSSISTKTSSITDYSLITSTMPPSILLTAEGDLKMYTQLAQTNVVEYRLTQYFITQVKVPISPAYVTTPHLIPINPTPTLIFPGIPNIITPVKNSPSSSPISPSNLSVVNSKFGSDPNFCSIDIELSWVDNSDNEEGFNLRAFFDDKPQGSGLLKPNVTSDHYKLDVYSPVDKIRFEIYAYNLEGLSSSVSTTIAVPAGCGP